MKKYENPILKYARVRGKTLVELSREWGVGLSTLESHAFDRASPNKVTRTGYQTLSGGFIKPNDFLLPARPTGRPPRRRAGLAEKIRADKQGGLTLARITSKRKVSLREVYKALAGEEL